MTTKLDLQNYQYAALVMSDNGYDYWETRDNLEDLVQHVASGDAKYWHYADKTDFYKLTESGWENIPVDIIMPMWKKYYTEAQKAFKIQIEEARAMAELYRFR